MTIEELAAIKKRHEHTAACLSMYGRSHALDGESAVEDRATLLDALEAAEAREKRLREVIKEIARQRLPSECGDGYPDEPDWEAGYVGCVQLARKAIPETAP